MDNKTTIVLLAGMLLASACIMHGCHQYEETQRTAIKAGLEQKQQLGTGYFWSHRKDKQ